MTYNSFRSRRTAYAYIGALCGAIVAPGRGRTRHFPRGLSIFVVLILYFAPCTEFRDDLREVGR